MGAVRILAGLAVFLTLSTVSAKARYLFLSCTIHQLGPQADPRPLTYSVAIDLDRRAIADVAGDGGEGWVLDSVSATTLSAHFDHGNQRGTMRINRLTGKIDDETVVGTTKLNDVIQETGFCREVQPKF